MGPSSSSDTVEGSAEAVGGGEVVGRTVAGADAVALLETAEEAVGVEIADGALALPHATATSTIGTATLNE